jgi:Leucine-rich repeat (LRR) protein
MKNTLLFFFALLVCATVVAQVSEKETLALQDLYNATDGNNWNQQWDLSQEVSNWPGVTVKEGHVTEIRMLFNNLQGTLPASLADLSNLKVLELSFNKLTGDIPNAIGNIKTLEVLALNGNKLNGSIPNSIGSLLNLKQLHLSSNELSGNLPSSLNLLKNLEVFNVFDNNLSGPLPIKLASSRNLKEFMVAENNFKDTSEISTILLSNSGGHFDLKEHAFIPTGKTIIAIETSDDDEN